MNASRRQQLAVTLAFLAAIFGVGIVQVAIEASRGERPLALALFTRAPTAQALRDYGTRLEDESWIATPLRVALDTGRFEIFGDIGSKAIAGRDGWLFYRPGVEYAALRWTAAEIDAAGDAAVAIQGFRDRLARRGIRLLVVPAPNKATVYPGRLTRRAEGLRLAAASRTQELLAALRSAEVEVADLFQAFADAKEGAGASGGTALYLAQDSHWSPAGVELAARVVAWRLVELGWVRPGDAAFQSRSAQVERTGDIVRMLGAPPVERRVPPERVPCRRVVAAETGDPYRDDPASEILVLGDSFLRIYETDEPGAAGFIAHLARELKRPLSSLVSDGGASTLVRQELFRRPALLERKRVVVWEFVERDIRYGAEGWQDIPLPPAPTAE